MVSYMGIFQVTALCMKVEEEWFLPAETILLGG
jgi:hypothetical protein